MEKSKVSCVMQPRMNEDSQQSSDHELDTYHFTKTPTSFKTGDGGVSFKEMTNKRKFLHNIIVCDDLYLSNFKANFISSFINVFSCWPY